MSSKLPPEVEAMRDELCKERRAIMQKALGDNYGACADQHTFIGFNAAAEVYEDKLWESKQLVTIYESANQKQQAIISKLKRELNEKQNQ